METGYIFAGVCVIFKNSGGEKEGLIVFCAKCGESSFTKLQANQYQCSKCHFTYFHNVAAAVSAIINVQGNVLLTARAKAPGKGLLDLPGGFVDPGESLEQALVRELKEELAFKVENLNYLFSFANPYLFRDVEYNTVESVFEIRCAQQPFFNIEKEEISQIIWLPPNKIEQNKLAFESTKRAIQAYMK